MSAESELPKKVKLLLTSTLYNDINGVRRALRFVDVNSSGSDLVTAIHLVAEKGYTEMAKFLVTVKGINLNLRTVYGNTPLKLSVYHNHFKITIILLEAGADPNALSLFDMTPLHTATFHGRLPFVEALIEYKADKQSGNQVKRKFRVFTITGFSTNLHHPHVYCELV
ncbi:glutaminase liver isoform, mitochondrial-like isoform X4 [Rhodnius prolixus]|uniref:glutaminase liver isoform, mitochondrial-like isoform X4 n=1 Tax=Rhodnius prolixus TaxID=13249 RepID=UPI003D188CF7